MSQPHEKQHALDVLARIVDASVPHSLLCCGVRAQRIAERWAGLNPDVNLQTFEPQDAQARIASLPAADLALVSDTLEHIERAHGAHVLGLLRNYGSHRIAVVVPAHGDWQFNDFIAMGFRLHAELADDMVLYTYNLASYNHKRDWNNPRNWANPEMWDKARW